MSILRLPILIFAATLACLPARAVEYVDLELVLAIEVSRSIDAAEADMQRQGYITALTDPKAIGAIRRKLVLEIAGRTPALAARLWRVAARVAPPCDIGESRREQRRRLRGLRP